MIVAWTTLALYNRKSVQICGFISVIHEPPIFIYGLLDNAFCNTGFIPTHTSINRSHFKVNPLMLYMVMWILKIESTLAQQTVHYPRWPFNFAQKTFHFGSRLTPFGRTVHSKHRSVQGPITLRTVHFEPDFIGDVFSVDLVFRVSMYFILIWDELWLGKDHHTSK